MPYERRTEARLLIRVPVYLVSGNRDRAAEQVITENVSTHGACVICTHSVRSGERHAISSMSLERHLGARVVYCQARSDKTYCVGLAFDQCLANWWDFGMELESAAGATPQD